MARSSNPAEANPPLSAAHLAAVLANVADGIIVTDADGQVRFVNDSAARIAHLEESATFRVAPFEALVDRYAFFDPEGHPVPPHDLPTQRALRGEGGPETILHLRERDTGREEWWAIRVSVLRDADGALDAVVAHFRDITEQRRIRERERFLANASTLLASTLDYEETLARVARLAVPGIADWCGVDILTDDDTLTSVAVAHVDPEKVALAHEFRRRYPPDPSDASGAIAVMRTGQPLLVPEVTDAMIEATAIDAEHLRMLRALGMHSVMVLPLIARERVLGRLTLISSSPAWHFVAGDLVFAQELAHRAAVAIDNARLYRAVQTAEERYRALFIGTADAVVVTDIHNRYIDANPALLALTGYDMAELRGMRVGDLTADTQVVTETRESTLRDGQWRGEFDLRRKDGSLVPVEATMTVVPLPTEPVFIGAFRDISERREQARSQQEFLAMVAHDLRTPLTSMKGYIDLMHRRGVYNERFVETIAAQAGRLDRLLNDMLDVTRLDAHRLELNRGTTDLVSVIHASVAEAEGLGPGHPIRVEMPAGPVIGWWDADRIAQVVQNLLANAIKYSPDGGDITVRVDDRGDAVAVSIADSGIGIPPSALPHLFDRFYRADNAKSGPAKGIGLGLYICKGLVEAHGGALTVTSTLGQGSTFTFTLPHQSAPSE